MIKCPYCSEEIQDTAKKCRFCGEWLKEVKKDIRYVDNKYQEKKELNITNKLTLEKKLKYLRFSKIFALIWLIDIIFFVIITWGLNIESGVFLIPIAGLLFSISLFYNLKYKGYSGYYIFLLLLSLIGVLIILLLKDKNPELK